MRKKAALTPGQVREVRRYLETGRHEDPVFSAWPGQNIFESCTNGDKALREALLDEVQSRLQGLRLPSVKLPPDLVAFTRGRAEPMVRGLFPTKEQEPVLGLLEHSVTFVTPDNFEQVVRDEEELDTAWDVASFFLASVGARPLGRPQDTPVGLSAAGQNYVSIHYFRCREPCADYVVHECAHVFHDTKRRTVGLPFTRRKEWLLDIEFRNRELFAHCCESYRCLLEQGRTLQSRRDLLKVLGQAPPPPCRYVDFQEYLSVLEEAVQARNGWKVILRRCAPKRST